jgi:hypothetical protein
MFLAFQVHSHVDVYNFTSNTWTQRFHMPKEMAHSHLGMASDGRYIYAVSGQYGPQCRASINRNFVFDTETREWHGLPPLPLPRYVSLYHFLGMYGTVHLVY